MKSIFFPNSLLIPRSTDFDFPTSFLTRQSHLAYPSKKCLRTGWDEPWHYRYVGVEVAKFIKENDICYEEFYKHYSPDFKD